MNGIVFDKSLSEANLDSNKINLSDYVNKLKAELNVKKTVAKNIKSAKRDFSGYITKAADSLEGVADQLTDFNLSDVSNMMKEAVNVYEKTTILLGLLKNVKKEFWLALVQLLVDAAIGNLAKQRGMISNMVSALRSADLPSSVKNSKVSRESLVFAYNRVVIAKKHLEEARDKVSGGGSVIKRYTDSAIALLRAAEQKLLADLKKIRDLGKVISAIADINRANANLVADAADYIVYYISTLSFVRAIYFIEERVLKGKQVLDAKTAKETLATIIKAIETKTRKPMSDSQEKWKTKPPSQISLVKDAIKYSKNARLHWENIEIHFGAKYESLSDLESNSQEYSKLLTGLSDDDYLNADYETVGQDVKDIASRVSVPSINVFAENKGSKSSVFKNMRTKYIKELNSVVNSIGKSSTTLSTYGSHKSKLLEFVNEGLVALGYQGNPMLDFARGKLIKTSDIIQGAPSTRTFLFNNVAKIVGFAASGSYKEHVESEIIALAAQTKAAKELIENRKLSRNIENIMDKILIQIESEQEAIDEEIKILEAGINGEVPVQYSPQRGLLAHARY